MNICLTSFQSATSYDSLVGVFNYKPFDDKVDWSLVAKASPCYMTVWCFSFWYPFSLCLRFYLFGLIFTAFSLEFGQYMKDSIDQIVKFFESDTAVSHTIALETAAAVQVLYNNISALKSVANW